MDADIYQVIDAVNGKAAAPIQNRPIEGVSTDTRTIKNGDLFFALSGDRFDGHDFIGEAIKKGAAHLIFSNRKKLPDPLPSEVNFILVPDVLGAYGDLAAFWRKQFLIPVIGITGSSGKTTTKEMIAHLLGKRWKVVKNIGTENNLVGVPKTIFRVDRSTEVLVLELGTNHPGEIERLASIASPTIGVLTRIGYSHLEGLGSIEGVKKEKLGLLRQMRKGGTLVLNGDDPMLSDLPGGEVALLRAGLSAQNLDLRASSISFHESGSRFAVGSSEMVEIPLLGKHNVLNSLLALKASELAGMTIREAVKSLAGFSGPPGRLTVKRAAGVTFIDDTYNSNPTSFEAALEVLDHFSVGTGRRGLVFGDMLELGQQAEELHRQSGMKAAASKADFLIGTGTLSRLAIEEAIRSGYDPKKAHWVRSSDEAGRLCQSLVSEGDMVLVKGSRGMKMEKVFECFTTSSIR